MSSFKPQITSPKSLEDVLRRAAKGPDLSVWERVRGELFRRADAEGLIDVALERHDSPLGTILVAATDTGLVRVGLPAEPEDAVLDELTLRVSSRALRGPRDTIIRARGQLEEYFNATRHTFDLPLDWRLTTEFRRKVLHATAQIPYGQTSTYQQVASQAGSPAAVRAAGTALALNPLPIIVPCHRVLRTDGQLGNYRGGAQAKAQLLDLERAT